MTTVVEFFVEETNKQKAWADPLKLELIINQAKEIEKQQNKQVICKDCNKPISVDDINNHLFMNIKGGGLIHWNCADK